jgi:hypothetical protein
LALSRKQADEFLEALNECIEEMQPPTPKGELEKVAD